MLQSGGDLFSIDLPYAHFGVVVADGYVVDAAPIARWMFGKPISAIREWITKKGGWMLNVGLAMNAVGAEVADESGCFSIKTSVDIIQSAAKVGIVGSRDYPELERVETLVGLLHSDAYVISGGALGVDRAATSAGLSLRRSVIEFKPMGSDKGLWVRAAFTRNEMIAMCSDVVVAFWNGESKGTADTIRHAMRISGKCIVALPGQPPAVWVPKIT